VSARVIEIFAKRQLIASHVRLFKSGARASVDEHRPSNHRSIVHTTIERLMRRAAAIATSVTRILREQLGLCNAERLIQRILRHWQVISGRVVARHLRALLACICAARINLSGLLGGCSSYCLKAA
jgi:hypothetical protein